MQKQIQLFTNFFKVDIKGDIFKYDIIMDEMDQSAQQSIILNTILRNKENKEKISQILGKNFLFLNNSIYSLYMMSEVLTFNTPEGVKISIQSDSSGPEKQETRNAILGRLFKNIQKKLWLKQVGRKLFNIKESVAVKSFEIWPGFATSFSIGKN